MQELLNRLPTGDIIPMLLLSLTVVAALIVLLAWQWRLHRRTELEILLKREMVSRGMSAEEIERVLAAGSSSCERKAEPAPSELAWKK